MKSVKNKTLSNVSWTRVPIVPSYYIKNNNSYHTNQFSYRTATLILILKFIVNSKKKLNTFRIDFFFKYTYKLYLFQILNG